MSQVVQCLQKEREKINALLDTCCKLHEREIAISSKEFFSLTKMIQRQLGIRDKEEVPRMQGVIEMLETEPIKDPDVTF